MNENVRRGDYTVPAKSQNTMSAYEVVHNPYLFNFTEIGKATLGKTSSSVLGSPLTKAGETVSKNLLSPTQHW